MKKLFSLLAAGCLLAACNNSANTADNKKDSLDSVAKAQKEMVDSTTKQGKQQLDSAGKVAKQSIDSNTKATKKLVDRADSLRKGDTVRLKK
jgi:hypothetical protein